MKIMNYCEKIMKAQNFIIGGHVVPRQRENWQAKETVKAVNKNFKWVNGNIK